MKYEVKGKKDGRVEVAFSLDAKEWETAIENAYQKNKGKYKKEGFRQGRVPRKVLENTYGEYIFYEDAFDMAFPKVYTDMLKKETSIDPIDYPEIKWESVSDKGISFVTFITVMPEIVLGKYKGIEIVKDKVEVKDSEIKHELSHYQDKASRYVDVENRPIQKGDLVTFDFAGSVNGKLFEGGSSKNFELEIGSGRFIPGFEDQMIGLSINGEADLNVKFPADYHAMDLAGKDAVFHVVIHGIREKKVPKIDDELVKDVSEFNTLDELKADIKKKLLEEKEKDTEYKAENELIEKIVQDTKLEVPSVMVDRQLDTFIDDMRQKLAYQGLKLEDFFKYTNSTEEQYRKERRDEAEKVVRTSLVMEAIVGAEKISVTDEEMDAKLEEIAKSQGKKLKEVKSTMNEAQKNVIKNSVLSEKVIKVIKSLNKIK